MINSLSPLEITKACKKNRAQILAVITHLNRLHNQALKKQAKLNELTLDNIFSKLLLTQWVSILEIEFSILIYENYNFTEEFLRSTNPSSLSEYNKWIALTKFFFNKQYLNNMKKEIKKTNIGDTNYHRYESIIKIIENEIEPFIELRNRISHGQWAVAFNNAGIVKNIELTQRAWTLSKKDLMMLKIIIENLPKLLKLLITSKKTFERDYDIYINKINLAKQDVDLRFKGLVKFLLSKK